MRKIRSKNDAIIYEIKLSNNAYKKHPLYWPETNEQWNLLCYEGLVNKIHIKGINDTTVMAWKATPCVEGVILHAFKRDIINTDKKANNDTIAAHAEKRILLQKKRWICFTYLVDYFNPT